MPFVKESMGETLRRMKQSASRRENQRRPRRNDMAVAIAPPLQHHPHGWTEQPVSVPADVLAERAQRALLEPRNLTAAILGDPLPGRSALDKRRTGA